jgi:hypothetical protein
MSLKLSTVSENIGLKNKRLNFLEFMGFSWIFSICCLFCTLLCFVSTGVLAASFDFNPTNAQFTAGCKNSINIMADARGQSSNAADIELYYKPAEIDILDSVSSIAGTQIKPGDAYETYFGNDVNTTTGRIRLAGASFVGQLTDKKVFATIEFTSKPNITSTSFSIKFDGVGATLDSNIADSSTSDDLLSSVSNGTYTFATGSCVQDKIPPVITFKNPQKYAVGVALDSQINIGVTDNMSGVDLAQTTFDINGDLYTTQSPELSYTGQPLDYTFVIKPRNLLLSDKESVIRVKTADKAGNKNTDTNVFNIPVPIIKEKLCPEAAGATTNTNNTSSNTNSNSNVNNQSNNQNNNTTNINNSSTSTENPQTASNAVDNNSTTSGSSGNVSTTKTNTTSNNPIYVLSRTGGTLQDVFLKTYWWGVPLLIIICIVVVYGRGRWLKDKNKTNLN